MNAANSQNEGCAAPRGLMHGELTGRILGCFYEVYRVLGDGFLETVYGRALELEMRARGLRVERQVLLEVFYKNRPVGLYRADQLVEGTAVLEVKSTPVLTPADHHQLMNYLRCTKLEVGLLLHFGPKPSFKRMISTNTEV